MRQGHSSHLDARFRVARLRSHHHQFQWIGSKGGFTPPSALRSMASPTTGTTLQRLFPGDWQSTGNEVRECVWGWRPRHIQSSVWTTDPFTDRMAILTVILKITIRASVIGVLICRRGNRYAYSADSFLSPGVFHHQSSGPKIFP